MCVCVCVCGWVGGWVLCVCVGGWECACLVACVRVCVIHQGDTHQLYASRHPTSRPVQPTLWLTFCNLAATSTVIPTQSSRPSQTGGGLGGREGGGEGVGGWQGGGQGVGRCEIKCLVGLSMRLRFLKRSGIAETDPGGVCRGGSGETDPGGVCRGGSGETDPGGVCRGCLL